MSSRKVLLIALAILTIFTFISCGSPSDPASPTVNNDTGGNPSGNQAGGSNDAIPIPMVFMTGGPANKVTEKPADYPVDIESEVKESTVFFDATELNPVIVDSYFIAETETTYAKWYEVYKWATDAARGSGIYSFANAGREGDDGVDGAVPTEGNLEPVTSISYRDAIIWCNAASEKEGLTPAYWLAGTTDYSDSSKVIRKSETRTEAADGTGKAENAVVNPASNGYRLPTELEWEFAARGGSPVKYTWHRPHYIADSVEELDMYCVYYDNSNMHTAPVKSKSGGTLGLYDINGNITELCYAETTQYAFFRGGGFTDNESVCVNNHKHDIPFWDRGYDVGFRTVRSIIHMEMKQITGGTVTSRPTDVDVGASDDPFYTCGVFAFLQPSSPIQVNSFAIAETETTYDKWYEVYKWATEETSPSYRYTFITKGKEGGTGTTGAAPVSSAPRPVSDISWRDAIVWCNAASEMEGLTPVYWKPGTTEYTSKSNVLRKAQTSAEASAGSGDAELAVINPDADGYRLPKEIEWEFAARGGSTSGTAWNGKYAGTDGENSLSTYAVYRQKMEDGASPVKTKKPNAAGLYDMSGNVWEWCQDEDLYDEHSYSYHYRFRRGGDYQNRASYCTVTYRISNNPSDYMGNRTGFRVAQNVPATN